MANEGTAPAEYYDLGAYHRQVTTANAEAQRWFDRGLIWCYGFNHEEGAECFQRAISHDPECAMAYWGLAYSRGPNYNKPWEYFDEQDLEDTTHLTHSAAIKAKEKAVSASAVEKALIEAVQFRYPREHAPQKNKECAEWNQGYAQAMRSVYQEFPDDLDVATLFADALMNLTPWHLWDLRSGKPTPGSFTIEVKSVLDHALTQDGALAHPGVLHLYIHLMEMSSTPEAALTIADNLRGLVPDSGHLNHMPSHLDIICGEYRQAVASNGDAIRADEKFLAKAGPLNFYSLYRMHDYHFRIYGAMFSGQSKIALETVARLEASIPEELLRIESPPMADWLEGFLSTRVHVMVRFGRWADLIALPLPQDQNLYCVTTAMILYAKGVALAATGNIEAAEEVRVLFQDALQKVAPSRTLFNNKCLNILAVARAMLDGELQYRRKNYTAAFEHLQDSIALDDALPYDEPWGWMQPTRHAYGALLLEQGEYEKAAAVYAADLGFNDTLPRALRHPNNVWSLHGYHECLTKLGRAAEAGIVKPQLQLALAVADVPIKASCFCRLTSHVDTKSVRL